MTHELVICYGKAPNKLPWSVIVAHVDSGFLQVDEFVHSCPRPARLYRHFLKHLKPTSVLDCFMGSGTTAQVCEELNIPYLGFEIEEKYAPDIEKRIALGQKARSQGRLF